MSSRLGLNRESEEQSVVRYCKCLGNMMLERFRPAWFPQPAGYDILLRALGAFHPRIEVCPLFGQRRI